METWPGSAYPLGATFDGSGTNFALFSEVGRARRAVPVRRATAPRPASSSPRSTPTSGTATCRTCSPGSATATACTASTTRRNGPALQPEQAAARPLRQGDRGRVRLGPVALRVRLRRPRLAQRRRLRRPRDAARRHQPVLRLGRRPHRRTRPYTETVIYEAHVKGLTQLHPDVPEEQRGTYAGVAHPADDRAPPAARRDGDRADAGAPVRAGHDAARTRACATTGATTPSASSPRTTTTRRRASSGSRCRSSRRWCGRCTRRASR